MTVKGFKNVSLREPLYNDIKEIVKEGRYGSVADFVAEAVRLRLEQLEKVFTSGEPRQ